MPHRYFSTEITQGRAWLSEADSRHLCVVMRAQAGQAVTVCDGRGTDYACRLAAVSPTRAGLDILSSEACVSEPSVRVILYVGCLLYTSDAADDLPCVDLGGRRHIKKKKISTKV